MLILPFHRFRRRTRLARTIHPQSLPETIALQANRSKNMTDL
jgi:hypothetical protein